MTGRGTLRYCGARGTILPEVAVVYAALALATLTSLYLVAYEAPVVFAFLTNEDAWTENATFVSWILASATMLWLVIRSDNRWQPGVLVFTVVSFIIGMEEISWGQRILGISTPEPFRQINYQGELTLHNLALPNQYYGYIPLLIIIYSIALPLLAASSSRLKTLCNRLAVPLVKPRCLALFLLPVYFLGSTFIPIPRTHELGEATLGLAMAIHAVDYVHGQLAGSNSQPAEKIAVTLGSLIIVGLFTALLTVGETQSTFKKNINDFAVNKYPRNGMYDQALRIFDYLRENPELATDTTAVFEAFVYFEKGDVTSGARRATAVLDEVVQRLERQPDAEMYRRAAQMLFLLERPQEARRMLLQAITFDQRSIGETDDGYAKARHRASIGLTLLGLSDKAAADRNFRGARDAVTSRRDRERISAEITREEQIWRRLDRIQRRRTA